jgi:thiosulfate reductase cytochrome b subunit
MKTYQKINLITGWVVFLISSVVYLMTIEPTASFWDCGEFIATAFKQEVGHPPGAPLFMIMGRVAQFFVGGNLEKISVSVNVLSALASAFTILFLFWSITHLARKFVMNHTLPLQQPKTRKYRRTCMQVHQRFRHP